MNFQPNNRTEASEWQDKTVIKPYKTGKNIRYRQIDM